MSSFSPPPSPVNGQAPPVNHQWSDTGMDSFAEYLAFEQTVVEAATQRCRSKRRQLEAKLEGYCVWHKHTMAENPEMVEILSEYMTMLCEEDVKLVKYEFLSWKTYGNGWFSPREAEREREKKENEREFLKQAKRMAKVNGAQILAAQKSLAAGTPSNEANQQ